MNEIIEALQSCFISEQEKDRKGEPANLVDALFAVARGMTDLAASIRNKRLDV